VRSADEQLLAGYYAGDELKADIVEAQRQLFQFEQLAQRGAAPRPASLTSPAPAAPPSIQVYRGNDATRQTP
jgi:pilus assembly protein CpaB